MSLRRSNQTDGFSLVEMLLVMVIVSSMIYMGLGYVQQRTLNLRIDRTTAQMQQILNAGLSYYVSNGAWPTTSGSPATSLPCLQGSGCTVRYLPTPLPSPMARDGSAYITSNTTSTFTVQTKIMDSAGRTLGNANILAGKLPLATVSLNQNGTGTCVATSTTCYVTASVNIPGQNLNNASAVNYAGIYHNGACVPAPQCPNDANGNPMTPEIMVVPAAVSGVNDSVAFNSSNCNASNTTGCTANAYPLTSFVARATSSSPTLNSTPPSCSTGAATPCYASYSAGNPAAPGTVLSGRYWRVCLSVATEIGTVSPASNWQGQLMGTVMAITRCKISNESSGSDFTVYSN